MPLLTCPTDDRLHQFLTGTIPDADADGCEQHLLECSACLQRVRNLRSGDPFTETLARAAEPTFSPSDEATLARIFVEIQALREETSRAGAEATQVGDQSEDDVDELRQSFAPSPVAGEIGRLGSFRVRELLGRGGMGAVFLAFDETLQRQVALKLLLPRRQDAAARERFLREARAMAAVRHDHVVAVFQVGEVDGRPFLAEELLEGETLDARLKRDGRLPVDEAIRIARETALGLAAAHAKGLLHRDIKPANIWLEAGTGRVKILDFGLALATSADAQLTDSGTVMGTPAYMAPEQARGERVDARADLFSLGGVLYRMLTGDPAFSGPTMMSVLTAIATQDPHPPRTVRPEVPPELSALVLRLLAKHRDARPATADDVARELQSISAQLVTPASTAPPRRPVRRLALALAAVAAVALAVVIVKIRTKDGQEKEVAVQVEGEVESVTLRSQNDAPQAKPVAAHASPFDALDPAAIPPEERFDWQPEELVAVLGSHRQRMWGNTFGITLSADGTQAALQTLTRRHGGPYADGFGCLLDTRTGQVESPFDASLSCLAISPDGASAFGIGTKRVVVRRSGKDWTLHDLPAPPWVFDEAPAMWYGRFSRDSRWLAGTVPAAGQQHIAVVWDVSVERPKVVCELRGYEFPSMSPDRTRLAALTQADEKLEVFDLTQTPPRRLAVVPDYRPLKLNTGVSRPDYAFLAEDRLVTLSDGRLALWDLATLENDQPRLIYARPDSGRMLTVSTDAPARILTTHAHGDLQLWSTGPDEFVLDSHQLTESDVEETGLSSDGRTVVAAQRNLDLRIWDLKDEEWRERHALPPAPVAYDGHPLAASPNGRYLATRGAAGPQVWEFGGGQPQRLKLRGEIVPGTMLCGWTDDVSLLYGWSECQVRGGEVQAQVKIHAAPWSPIRAVPGRVLSTSPSGGCALWDLSARPPRRRLTWTIPPERWVFMGREVTLSADGRRCAVLDRADKDSSPPTAVRVWDVSGTAPEPTLLGAVEVAGQTTGLELSSDGSRLAASSLAELCIYEVDDRGLHVAWKSPRGCGSLCISPNARLVATQAHSGPIEVRTLERDEVVYQTYFGQTYALAFAPDSRHLLTANANGTVYVLRLPEDLAQETTAAP